MSAAPAEETASAPTAKLLAPGDVVDGRYRIESYLGGGGMASVYRATHMVLEQAVAIKVVSPVIRQLPGMAQRFLREARAATQLKSEHVARVSDVGTMADGAPYLVMEYLDGRDLDAVLESGEDIPVEEAVDLVLQTCEALAEVHGLGIVHRDLKPANLFLTRGADGLPCVKLIDFGISRTDSPLAAKDLVGLTQPETVMGSPRYMSPEQMESATKADSRSDIYGLGCVLYELLTRKAPHEGETFLDIYAAATLGPPVVPSKLRHEVPGALDDVTLRCLAIDPDDRYNDIAELAVALAPFGPEGSLLRAGAIARIHDAARSRTRDANADGEPVTVEEHSSRIRRRVSSSAHSLRRRRIKRGMIGATLLALAGLAFGGRVLYTQGQASGIASVAAPPLVAAPPAVDPAPSPPPAPLAAAPLPSPADTIASTTETTAAKTEAKAGAAALAVAPLVTPAAAVAVAPAIQAAQAAQAAPKWTPPPRPVATYSAPPPPAPTSDERQLFEDRK